MNNPLVSVVVATYRRDVTLSRALNSLAGQMYKNIEIVMVDDNADAPWNAKVDLICNQFQANNNLAVRHITNNTNQGSAKTRNIGIEESKGTYITFLDDDDEYLPDKIALQLSEMLNHEADYSVTDLALYDENDRLVETRKRDCTKSLSGADLLKYHLMYHLTGTDTMMFKKDYLIKIGMFDEIDVGDEFYLMNKAIENQGKFTYVQRCDVKAYIHSADASGLSSGTGKIIGENQLYDFKKKYYKDLDRKTISNIAMRHHAVLAFCYLKSRKIIRFAAEGAMAVLSSPMGAMKILADRIRK